MLSMDQNVARENMNDEDTQNSKQTVPETDVSPTENQMPALPAVSRNEILQILDFIHYALSSKNSDKIASTFTCDGIWKAHPHDPARMYKGKKDIKAMWDEIFLKKQSIGMQYVPESIIFDSNTSVCYVEWVITATELTSTRTSSSKQMAYAVTLKFQDLFVKNRISELKCYAVKTTRAWTRKISKHYHADVIIGQQSVQQENNEKKVFRKNRKAIETPKGQEQPEPQIEIEGKQPKEESVELALPRIDDALQKTNGQKSKIKFMSKKKKEEQPDLNAISPVKVKKLSKKVRKNNARRNNNNNARRNNNNNNRKWKPWICHVCQGSNEANWTKCCKCNKQFQFAKDLTRKQKNDHLAHKAKIRRNQGYTNRPHRPNGAPVKVTADFERRMIDPRTHKNAPELRTASAIIPTIDVTQGQIKQTAAKKTEPKNSHPQQIAKKQGPMEEALFEPMEEALFEAMKAAALFEPMKEALFEPTKEALFEPMKRSLFEPLEEAAFEPMEESAFEPGVMNIFENPLEEGKSPLNEDVARFENETLDAVWRTVF